MHLVQSNRRSHSALDVKGADVLPVLLQKRHQEVDGQMNVENQLILSHLHVTNGNVQAQDLLHLELDGGLEVVDLGVEVVAVLEKGWELASLVETWTQETWDLLDERLGGEEGIVLLGQLLDQLLVLVQLFQVVHAHEGHALVLGLVTMSLVSEDADSELWSWNMLQPIAVPCNLLYDKKKCSTVFRKSPQYLRPWVGVRQGWILRNTRLSRAHPLATVAIQRPAESTVGELRT